MLCSPLCSCRTREHFSYLLFPALWQLAREFLATLFVKGNEHVRLGNECLQKTDGNGIWWPNPTECVIEHFRYAAIRQHNAEHKLPT